MKKYFNIISIFCIILFLFSHVQDSIGLKYEGKKIKAIFVKGIKNTVDSIVYDSLTFKKGDIFNTLKLNQSVSNIYKTEFYKDVKTDIIEEDDQLILTFIVEECPVVKEIEFHGNHEFSKTDLYEEIHWYIDVDNILCDYRLKDANSEISNLYYEEGLEDTIIMVSIITDHKENTCKIIYRIVEEDRVRVNKIKIIQTKAYDEIKIIELMKTHVDDWQYSGIFNENVYKKDIQNIINFYQNNGYIHIKIEDELKYRIEGEKRDKGKKLYITVKLHEGDQYKFDGYSILGNQIFSKDKLKSLINLKKGEIFNLSKFKKDISQIQQAYSNQGYIFAKIYPEQIIDEEKKTVKYNINIKEGKIIHIEGISIKGNTITKDYVIRRELLIKEGEIANAEKIKKSRERVYNLGFFYRLSFDLKPGSEEGLMNLVISVEEVWITLMPLGIMYDPVGGFGGYTEPWPGRNLGGRGIKLNNRIEYQQRYQNYELGMSFPWIFNTPTTFSFSTFFRNRKELRTPSIEINDLFYKKQGFGTTLKLNRELLDTINLSSIYEIDYYQYYHFSTNTGGSRMIPENLNLRGRMDGENKVKSSLTFDFDYDSRDSIFNPTKGLHFNLSWSIVGGPMQGYDKYMKYITDVSKYFPIFSGSALVLHMNLGLIDRSFDGKPVRINPDDHLYLGTDIEGVESVRGYRYWSDLAGYQKWKYGGFSRLYSNIEFRQPIFGQWFWGVFFIDAGNLWRKTHLINLNYKEYFFSTGWGFRILIPLIPIRLYFSKRFWYNDLQNEWYLKDKTCKNWQVDFSVGGLF